MPDRPHALRLPCISRLACGRPPPGSRSGTARPAATPCAPGSASSTTCHAQAQYRRV